MLNKNLGYLQHALNTNQLSHLYLLNLQNQFNDDFVIFNIINILNEEQKEYSTDADFHDLYPNVYFLDGTEKNITKEEYQKIFYDSSFSNFDTSSKYKKRILIIKNVENSSINALNSILKFIEEPIENVCIILTTKNLNLVLPTIKSRAQTLNFNSTEQEKLEYINNAYGNNSFNVILSTLFKKEFHLIENIASNLDDYIKLFNDISKLFVKSISKKSEKNFYELYLFLDNSLEKNNTVKNTFVINLLQHLILSSSPYLDLENKYIKKIKDSNILVLEKNRKMLGFLNTISDFKENISFTDFNLQKTVLLIKLGDFYE